MTWVKVEKQMKSNYASFMQKNFEFRKNIMHPVESIMNAGGADLTDSLKNEIAFSKLIN